MKDKKTIVNVERSIAEINTVNFGSTGKIMLAIQKEAMGTGLKIKSYYGIGEEKNDKNIIKIASNFGIKLCSKFAHLFGNFGSYSFFATKRLIKQLKKDNVGVIHLHNLHISFINLPMLFSFIKKNNISVVWTLHDCWAFTGHCPYFEIVKCDKWKTGCYKCPQYKEYPQSTFDNSKKMWKRKKKWFSGVKDLTIVTPSKWLGDLVKQSYLKEYPVKVINNGIDLSIFKPTESSFREKYGIGKEKFILLGVAFDWGERKGFDVFIELAKRLDKEKFQIVLVGTNDELDKDLPKEIISIHKTQNQNELAEIYSASDLFVNPTREENYPTVNMEAIACGTPVLTFKTGGSLEVLDENTGVAVKCDDIGSLEKEVIRIEKNRPFRVEDCIKQSKLFDNDTKYVEYINLYNELLSK